MATGTALDSTNVITVRYSTRRTVLELVDREHAGARLFVLCTEPIPAGRNVTLKVTFADSNRNFYIRGCIDSIVERAGLRLGFRLLIWGADATRAFAHLLAFCSRNQEAPKRFLAEIPCQLVVGAGVVRGKIRDLSRTGAFISTGSSALKAGSKLVLSVKGGFLGLCRRAIEARVVWTGEKQGRRGFGAEFLSNAPAVMGMLRQCAIAR
jgi:hypothetical protein